MLALAASSALAQPAARQAASKTTMHPVDGVLKTVEQGVGDRSLLSRSLKLADLGTELRRDSGWERLYEFETRDGRRRYFRYSNGISASFTHSEFVMTEEDGEFSVTPGGTIFHIGRSVDQMAAEAAQADAQPAPPDSPLRVSNRFDPQAAALAAPRMTTTQRAAPARATVMTDESYRQRRVQGLLLRVSGGEPGATGDGAPIEAGAVPVAAQR